MAAIRTQGDTLWKRPILSDQKWYQKIAGDEASSIFRWNIEGGNLLW